MSHFELVVDWAIENGVGVTVNGEPLGYAVHIDGPMVEHLDEHHHILWMPLLADGPAPRAGRPDGEPVESHRNSPRNSVHPKTAPQDHRTSVRPANRDSEETQ